MLTQKNIGYASLFFLLSSCSAKPIDDPIPIMQPTTPDVQNRDNHRRLSNIFSAPYGKYLGHVEARWLDNGQMVILKDFVYIDPNNIKWVAPKNSIVNGASIPTKLWGFIGGPFTGKYRNASVIHDVACVERKRPWEMVHKAFYHAMKASDVSDTLAKVMYGAVYHFGPRWEKGGGVSRSIKSFNPDNTLSDAKLQQFKQLIENNKNISLEDIQNLDVSKL